MHSFGWGWVAGFLVGGVCGFILSLRVFRRMLRFAWAAVIASWATAREEAAAAAESWDYANRLLESPDFYLGELNVIESVADAPTYGKYGRIRTETRETK